MLAKLDEVENEMKKVKFWCQSEDEKRDTFEHWLQFTFLPNARKAIETNNLPKKSQVGIMALRQYDYHSVIAEAHPLMQLLFEFDKLVESEA